MKLYSDIHELNLYLNTKKNLHLGGQKLSLLFSFKFVGSAEQLSFEAIFTSFFCQIAVQILWLKIFLQQFKQNLKAMTNRSSSKVRTKTFNMLTPDFRRKDDLENKSERSEKIQNKFNSCSRKARFKRKNLQLFEPEQYVTSELTIEDIIDLKQVFDTYDSRGKNALIPIDVKLMLEQNGFNVSKDTLYEIVAEMDQQQEGGMSFGQFISAMAIKPHLNQSKKLIKSVFSNFDRVNKGFINIDDLKEQCKFYNEEFTDIELEALLIMMDYNNDDNDEEVNFEEFYTTMTKKKYY